MVSKEMGISSSQLQRLIFIHKHHPDHIELLDKGILTVNQSYLQIQRELKEKESRESKPNNKSKTTKNSSWRFYQKSSHDMSELKMVKFKPSLLLLLIGTNESILKKKD